MGHVRWLLSTHQAKDRVVRTLTGSRPEAGTQSLGKKRPFEPGFLLLAPVTLGSGGWWVPGSGARGAGRSEGARPLPGRSERHRGIWPSPSVPRHGPLVAGPHTCIPTPCFTSAMTEERACVSGLRGDAEETAARHLAQCGQTHTRSMAKADGAGRARRHAHLSPIARESELAWRATPSWLAALPLARVCATSLAGLWAPHASSCGAAGHRHPFAETRSTRLGLLGSSDPGSPLSRVRNGT